MSEYAADATLEPLWRAKQERKTQTRTIIQLSFWEKAAR